MNDVCIDPRRIEVCAPADRTKNRVQIFGGMERRRFDAEPFYGQMWLMEFLIPKTAHFDIHDLSQLTTQVVDVNTCAPINIWGVLVRQKEGFHSSIKD